MMKKNMCSWYHEQAFTDNYCFGYKANGQVLAALVKNVTLEQLERFTKLEKASNKNGGGFALKYHMNGGLWQELTAMAEDVRVICTVDELEEINRNSKKNRGYIFEELAAAQFNGELDNKLNTKFTDGGDFYINGVPFQAKYLKATFTNETTIRNMSRE